MLLVTPLLLWCLLQGISAYIPGVVKSDLEYVRARASTQNRHVRKRGTNDAVFEEPLSNFLTFYTMNMSIGEPNQEVTVLVDTGSSDLWVPGKSFKNGFDIEQSRSWNLLSKDFLIRYVKGFAKGLWGKDHVGFSSLVKLKSQRLAVATESSESDMGVFGIGPINSEVSNLLYDNVPASLVKQGHIIKNAYSIFLDDQKSQTGSILFGGIDQAKFIPPLQTVSMTSTSAMEVTLSAVEISDRRYELPTPVVLDTGTSLMYLPQVYVEAIAREFGATYDPETALFLASKEHLLKYETPDRLTFDLSGAVITVPFRELFWPIQWFVDTHDDSDLYALTMMSNSEALGYSILGDTFLRSAYVVYNIDDGEISLAQASYHSDSHVTPIVSPLSLFTGEEPAINSTKSSLC